MTSRSSSSRTTLTTGTSPSGTQENNIHNLVTVASNGAEALTMLLGDDHRDQGNPALILWLESMPRGGVWLRAVMRSAGTFRATSTPA
jgi:hypothetical protein